MIPESGHGWCQIYVKKLKRQFHSPSIRGNRLSKFKPIFKSISKFPHHYQEEIRRYIAFARKFKPRITPESQVSKLLEFLRSRIRCRNLDNFSGRRSQWWIQPRKSDGVKAKHIFGANEASFVAAPLRDRDSAKRCWAVSGRGPGAQPPENFLSFCGLRCS